MAKIAILTNMMEFSPVYSLTGIVKDQARMLSQYGHEVHLFVNEKYHGESFSDDIILHKKIPFAHLTDYTSRNDISEDHKAVITRTSAMYLEELKDMNYVFTHDFILTGWFSLYGLAVMKISRIMPQIRWFHWVHSVPSAMRDWWKIKEYGSNHRIIFPNKTDQIKVAEQFSGTIENVRVIPHIKDLRSWWEFHEDTCEFIKDYPKVMNSKIVQIYPASSDRLSAKNVDTVILIFSWLKKMGQSVCLVIANQWDTQHHYKDKIDNCKKLAEKNGLIVNRGDENELIFTSEWKKKTQIGIPSRMLRELMLCQNLFVFPTREESFGLVGPEAALSSACLMVLNKSLKMMQEIHGYSGIYFDFGSFDHTFQPKDEFLYLKDVSSIILGRMLQNESIISSTHHRTQYNWDQLYNNYYGPIMAESRMWI
jgi:glycosyltransferase involved in cell wall biosynthesis